MHFIACSIVHGFFFIKLVEVEKKEKARDKHKIIISTALYASVSSCISFIAAYTVKRGRIFHNSVKKTVWNTDILRKNYTNFNDLKTGINVIEIYNTFDNSSPIPSSC